MMKRNRTAMIGFGIFFLIGCTAIVVLLRVILSTSASAEPVVQSTTIPPEQLSTVIAQTGVAAASQTAGVSGTQTSQFYTPTFTLTFTPLGGAPEKPTDLNGQTVTPSVYLSPTLFVLPKWTPSPTATKKPRDGYTSDGKKTSARKTQDAATKDANEDLRDNQKHFGCNVLKTTLLPPTQPYAPNTNFTVKWLVENAGAAWDHNTVDIAYSSGTIGYTAAIYNIGSDVSTWGQYTISIPMKAPSKAGSYSAVWVMRASNIVFCELNVSIYVQ
jgi:hypothetical protein